MPKRLAVYASTIEEAKASLRVPFVRKPSIRQYKTVNGKRFTIYCGCNAKGDFEKIIPTYFHCSCFAIGNYVSCPVCKTYCYIDLSSLNLPKGE
jgi:hypothetical protein